MNAPLPDPEETVRSTRTEMNYLLPGTTINRRFVSAGVEVNTGRYAPYPVTVRDGRAIRRHFTLDTHGFMLADAPTAVRDFYDKAEVDRRYTDETVATVKALTGASFVAWMGWIIRNSGDISAHQPKPGTPYVHAGTVQPPAGEAHVDTTPDRAVRHARTQYDRVRPDGPGYRRFIYSSFWRTFSPGPQDAPLGLCDFRSVRADEGVPNVLQVVDRIPEGEAMFAAMDDDSKPAAAVFHHDPAHRWWYFSNMTRDEAILLKFHDSDDDVAWRVPHTSFWDWSFPDRQPRASIEFRTIAYFE